MIHRILNITLTLSGPILTKSTAAGAFGIDAVMAVHPNGCFYLPKSLVKGRLRQSLVELGQNASELFGPRVDAGDYDPHRSRVEFEDFLGPKLPKEMTYQTRIRIDGEKEAALGGMMQVAECPFGAGLKVPFTGRISFSAEHETEANSIENMLLNGLRWTPAFGAQTGIGFGRLVCVSHRQELRTPAAPTEQIFQPLDNDVLWAAYRPLDAFCLAKRRVNGNTFESEEFISGAAIKGVVATTLSQLTGCNPLKVDALTGEWADLGKHLHEIRFTHAFPAGISSVRPVEPPLSVVRVKSKTYDTAKWREALLIDGKSPTYSVDWKDEDTRIVRGDHGWPELKRETRVRTAIDYGKRRAMDENLFAYDMIVPRSDDRWLGSIDFAGVKEGLGKKVADDLQRLLQTELRGLGKTKSRMSVAIGKQWASAKSENAGPFEGNRWMVTLQTPALLANPLRLNNQDETSLEEAYAADWAELSGDTLKLSHFFARQTIAGGYLVKRFRPKQDAYEPYFLTLPGSVFVLESKDDEAAKKVISDWRRHGLKLPDWAVAKYGESWRTCPFRREEGFGEVVVNLREHFENLPDAFEVIK